MTDQGIIDALRRERDTIAAALREVDHLINVAAARFAGHADRRHCGTGYDPHSAHLWSNDQADYQCPGGRR